MTLTTLAQSTRLRSLGLPQSDFPQVCLEEDGHGWTFTPLASFAPTSPWVRAIHPVDALAFLEARYGWRWMRVYREYADTRSGEAGDGMVWMATSPDMSDAKGFAQANTAGELLDAVLARLEVSDVPHTP